MSSSTNHKKRRGGRGKKHVNPFKVPTDEEIFILREQPALKDKIFPKVERSVNVIPRVRFSQKKARSQVSTPKTKKSSSKGESGAKPMKGENMKDFITKKRKMFLLQMSLDSKKFEIQKLRQFVAERQKKLEFEEDCLIRDSRRFDDFLTENDISAINAINEAEEEKKNKISKKKEILSLRQKVKMIQLEIKKVQEQLTECKKYKLFLDSLTPSEELENPEEKKQPDGPNKTESTSSSHEKIVPVNRMYFKKPEQLLDKFSELEHKNLSLMKAANEVEKQLEDTKKTFRESKIRVQKRKSNLQIKIDEYTEKIEKEQDRCKELEEKLRIKEDHNNPMSELKNEIRKIYVKLGLKLPPNSDMEHLQMLSKIETEIERLITIIEEYNNPGWVSKKIKTLEKDRRQKKRQKNKNLMLKKSVVQKNEPVHYDTECEHVFRVPARPLMARSVPIDQKKKKKKKKVQVKRDGFHELFGH